MKLFDELDQNGAVTRAGFSIGPGYNIPDGYTIRPFEPSLDNLKLAKRALIEQWRDDVCTAGVTATVGGTPHRWQSDTRSQAILGNCITLASVGAIPCPPVWRDADNINVSVTLPDLKLIAGTIAYVTQQAFAHSWELKSQLDAAQTLQEIDAVVW